MTVSRPLGGVFRHFVLMLHLNVRSRQALVYGYLVPVLFLFAFSGIFRADSPPLLSEMGQLLTITILGGACFGLPTALVAERERGVWRRYRLLPVRTGMLVVSTLVARLVIVVSAALLVVVLARIVFGTPFPLHPGEWLLSFGAVTFSFLGLGLLVAVLADDVPAVQALGQCLFLPMIMVGGVGVPLVVLPGWAQRVAGFMPGRYAVDILQRSTSAPEGLRGAGFDLIALGIIGLAAGIIGAKRFRWETGQRAGRGGWIAVGAALLGWVAVGSFGLATGRLRTVGAAAGGYDSITPAQIDAITYDELPGDDELATRLAPPFLSPPTGRVGRLVTRLKTWPAAHTGNIGEDVRHLLCVAAIADIGADRDEGSIARVIFDELEGRFGHAKLRRVLAWIILSPDAGTVVQRIPGLDLRRGPPSEAGIRDRSVLYAKKLLGRLTGRISAP